MRIALIISFLITVLVGCANRTKTHTTKVEDISTFMVFIDSATNQETVSFSFDKSTSWEVQMLNWKYETNGFYTVAHGTGTDGEVSFGKWMKLGHDYDIRIVTDDGTIRHQFTAGKYEAPPVTIVLP